MGEARVRLSLHPKQQLAVYSKATEVLFGGAAGPGKSHAMRVAAIMWASEIPGLQIYLFRRLYDDLVKNHLEGPQGFINLLAPWLAAKYCRIVDDEIRFYNGPNGTVGSKIYLCHCQHEKDVIKYQGAEIHALLIDELTHFSEKIYRFLRGRCRKVGLKMPEKYKGMFPRILCGSNPGSAGHQWVKTTFIDGVEDQQIRKMPKGEGGMQRQFIRARLEDNPSLMDDDPDYENKLEGLGSATLVKAMREGDWDIVEGAFFTEWERRRHVVQPFRIPEHWLRFISGDWGSAKPYAFNWFAVASEDYLTEDGKIIPRGALVCYRELYGVRMKTDGTFEPNVGTKETVEEVAAKIKALQVPGESISYRVIDPATFASQSGPSIAETFIREKLWFEPADNKRVANAGSPGGHQQMRSRLKGNADGHAMIFFFENCLHTIRTIPVLQHDARNPEDIDTDMEDHAYDSVRYGAMSRPWIADRPVERPKQINTALPTFDQLVAGYEMAESNRERRIGG